MQTIFLATKQRERERERVVEKKSKKSTKGEITMRSNVVVGRLADHRMDEVVKEAR